ncbi:MAG: response regulator transcription factor [Flavobacteriales bacterium]|nr:response regulator transcription factor [Flavobacteriales bacterium]
MATSSKRILLVDDHQLIIDGIRGFLENEEDLQVVGEANSGEEAIRLTQVLEPHLILMDIEMPEVSGIQASEEIKRNYPEVKIIIISMHNEKQLIKKLIAKGIDGYLLKNSEKSEVINAIRHVFEVGPYFSEEVNNALQSSAQTNETLTQNTGDFSLAHLTERELEVLKQVANGYTNKEIGERLNISHRTVDTHRTNLMKKLDVTNVAGLIKIAFRNGLIE